MTEATIRRWLDRMQEHGPCPWSWREAPVRGYVCGRHELVLLPTLPEIHGDGRLGAEEVPPGDPPPPEALEELVRLMSPTARMQFAARLEEVGI